MEEEFDIQKAVLVKKHDFELGSFDEESYMKTTFSADVKGKALWLHAILWKNDEENFCISKSS